MEITPDVIGVLGFLFSIYTFFSTKKIKNEYSFSITAQYRNQVNDIFIAANKLQGINKELYREHYYTIHDMINSIKEFRYKNGKFIDNNIKKCGDYLVERIFNYICNVNTFEFEYLRLPEDAKITEITALLDDFHDIRSVHIKFLYL